MELPVLRLGLAGFTPEQECAVTEVAGNVRAIHWVQGPLAGADAWLLNGAQTQTIGGGAIRVDAAVPGGASVQLDVEHARRPVGFAVPLPSTLDVNCSFDLRDPGTLAAVLQQFEFWLAATQARFWLAGYVVDHGEALGAGVFELRLGQELAGVVDMRRKEVGVHPSLKPNSLDVIKWRRIARDSKAMPSSFERSRLEHLMWDYCERTTRDVLPERYRRGLIYYRRPPRVEPHAIRDEHLLVMRDLAIRPSAFDELMRRTGMEDEQLARVLSTLYYVGSITSNPRRLDQSTGGELASTASAAADLNPSSDSSSTVPNYHELTAPAPLRH